MSLPVRTTPEADVQIGAIDDWWRHNRHAAPDLFLQELAASFEVIGVAPQIGCLYRQSPVRGTRRVLLKESRYHVYYVHCGEGGEGACRVACAAWGRTATAHVAGTPNARKARGSRDLGDELVVQS